MGALVSIRRGAIWRVDRGAARSSVELVGEGGHHVSLADRRVGRVGRGTPGGVDGRRPAQAAAGGALAADDGRRVETVRVEAVAGVEALQPVDDGSKAEQLTDESAVVLLEAALFNRSTVIVSYDNKSINKSID